MKNIEYRGTVDTETLEWALSKLATASADLQRVFSEGKNIDSALDEVRFA